MMGDLKLQDFLNSTPEAVIIADDAGVIVFANSTVQRVFGYDPAELAGMPVDALVPEPLRQRHENGRLAYNTAPVAKDLNARQGLTAIRKDGTKIWVQVSLTPIRAVNRLFVVCVVSDVTERVRMADSLQASEQRFRALVETTTDWIWEVDAAGVYTYVSPRVRDLLGYEPEEVLGKTPFDLMPPEEAVRTRHLFNRAVTNKLDIWELENDYIRKDGRVITLETNGIPILDGEGNVLGFRGIDRDITNRKVLEQQLRRAQRMEIVTRLAGTIAHDFNNMVTVITGYTDLAFRHLKTRDTQLLREDLESIKASLDRAAALTNRLLTMGRKQVAEPRRSRVNVLITDLESTIRSLLQERVKLVLRLDPAAGSILVDRQQIEQALINVVLNARDAISAEGTLTIKTSKTVLYADDAFLRLPADPGEYVTVAITDTGSGIDANAQSHLFEPFFTTKPDGTGLGLAAVLDFMKQANGNVSIESEPGKGATLKMYFKPTDEEALRQSPAPAGEPDRIRTVLLAEDDDEVREMITRTLREDGYTVFQARDGEEAVAVAERLDGPLDAAVMDVVLPRKHGLDAARQLVARHPEAHVMFMSGYVDNPVVQYGIVAGGFEFLQKPFSAEALSRTLARVVESPAVKLPAPQGNTSLLFVAADDSTATMVSEFLGAKGFNVLMARDRDETLRLLDSTPSITVVFLDAGLEPHGGLALLASIMARSPRPTVILLGGAVNNRALVRDALRVGAFDYLPDPRDLNRLEGTLVAALGHAEYVKRSWWQRITG